MLRISTTEENFINELIIPFEIFEDIPDGPLRHDPSKREIELPEDWYSDEMTTEEFSELYEVDEIDFKDISYNLSVSNYQISISNQDFWFNNYPSESICFATDSGIVINSFTEIIKNKDIVSFFIYTLKNEIKRINDLPQFDSLMQLIKLQEDINSNYTKIWCDDVITIYESILSEIKLKIKAVKEDSNYKLISHILFLDSNITLEKHFLNIRTLINGFSENQINNIATSYITLIHKKYNLDEKILRFYQFQNKKYFTAVCNITLFHFRKLLNQLNQKNNLSKIIETNFKANNRDNSTFPINREEFTSELHKLFLITDYNLNKDETKILTNIISNKISPFPSNHPIINSFNDWLKYQTNKFLFKTFLKYASSINNRIIIPEGSFSNLSTSISCKFQYPGLSYRNLKNKYINLNEPEYKFLNSNKFLIDLIFNRFKTQKIQLETGIVKKMMEDFKELLKN